MFQNVFGEAFKQSNQRQHFLNPDSTDFLTNLADKNTVMQVFYALQEEFGPPSGQRIAPQEVEFLKRSGHNHFAIGRYCEASETYKRALELFPGDAMLCADVSLSLIRCCRYEEAVTYAHAATVAESTWPKGYALLAMAYAHLGYTDIATFYCNYMQTFGPEIAACCDRAITNSVTGKLDPSMYRTTTLQDLQMTLARCADTYLTNIDVLISLFVHLEFHVSYKEPNIMTQVAHKLRKAGFMRRLFCDIPLTSGVIRNPDLLTMTADEAHLLSSCLRIVGFVACSSPHACNDLLGCQEFLMFLSQACRRITSESFLKTYLQNRQRFVFHQLIVENLIRILCTATSQVISSNLYWFYIKL